MRSLAKSCVVRLLGSTVRPRKIMRGLAAGYQICVSPTENLSYLLGTAEPHLQRTIRKHVFAGDTVYDIGANVGYVSLSLAKRVGPEGYVAAFEPVATTCGLLRSNVEINRLPNIHVFQVAASDKAGPAVFRMPGSSSMASMIWYRQETAAVEEVVPAVVIDDLVDAGTIPPPKFVKVDVEGAEGQVILGMRRTISRTRPVLFVECSDTGRACTWQFLTSLHYLCLSPHRGESVNSFEEYRHSDFLWLPENTSA